MSEIRNIINDKQSVLIFDVDGVLAIMEFGLNTHFLDDDSWKKTLSDNINLYDKDKVSKKLQLLINKKDKNRIFVITKVDDIVEINQKKEYVNKYYGIIKENVYCVNTDSEKTKELEKIKSKFKGLDSKYFVMIDDTVEVLNDAMNNNKISTAHISTFIDM